MKPRRPPFPSPKTSKTLAPPQVAQVLGIEKPVYGGNFLAHHEGKAIFVPLTLPGEQVRARIVQSKSGYSTAELVGVITSSSERTAARCPHFGVCGG